MSDLITKLSADAVMKGIGPAANLLAKYGTSKYNQFIAKYTNALDEHIIWASERTSTVKNMIYRDLHAKTMNCYVAGQFRHKDDVLSDVDVLRRLTAGNKVVLSGSAGSGKTMFMKWAVQSLLLSIENHQTIPLFIDLRDITDSDLNTNFASFLLRKSVTEHSSLTLAQFIEGLKEGLITVFIDAVDEVPPSTRDGAIRSIVYLARNYPKVGRLSP